MWSIGVASGFCEVAQGDHWVRLLVFSLTVTLLPQFAINLPE